MANDWKERLQEIHKDQRAASQNKRDNESATLNWIRVVLIPASNELIRELPKLTGLESISQEANGLSLDNALRFKFEGISLRYFITFQISSESVKGESLLMAGRNISEPKPIPSILDCGEEEIINDFLDVFAAQKFDIANAE